MAISPPRPITDETDGLKDPTIDSPRETSEPPLPSCDSLLLEPEDTYYDEESSMQWDEPGDCTYYESYNEMAEKMVEGSKLLEEAKVKMSSLSSFSDNFSSYEAEVEDASSRSVSSDESSLGWEITHDSSNFDFYFQSSCPKKEEEEEGEFDVPVQPVWISSSSGSSPEVQQPSGRIECEMINFNSVPKFSLAETLERSDEKTGLATAINMTIPQSRSNSLVHGCGNKKSRGEINTYDLDEVMSKKDVTLQNFSEESFAGYQSDDNHDWSNYLDGINTLQGHFLLNTHVLDDLLGVEKQCRAASDVPGMKRASIAIIEFCFSNFNWNELNKQLLALSNNRGQHSQVIVEMFHMALQYVDMAPDNQTKINLLETLVSVSVGKVCLQLENARLIRRLAKVRLEQGFMDEAASLMLEINVDLILPMPLFEKMEYMLYQALICLELKDYGQAHHLLFYKMNPKLYLRNDSALHLKLTYCELRIRYHLHKKDTKEICCCYSAIYNMPGVKEDPLRWMPILRKICWYLMLTPKDPEIVSITNATLSDGNISSIPCVRNLLEDFNSSCLINWKDFWGFAKAILANEKLSYCGAFEVLRMRVIEHNILVLKTFYSRITLQRLADILCINVQETEDVLCRMVESKSVEVRIDRPNGFVVFQVPQDINSVLNTWASKVGSIAVLLDKICHQIEIEMMLYKPP